MNGGRLDVPNGLFNFYSRANCNYSSHAGWHSPLLNQGFVALAEDETWIVHCEDVAFIVHHLPHDLVQSRH